MTYRALVKSIISNDVGVGSGHVVLEDEKDEVYV